MVKSISVYVESVPAKGKGEQFKPGGAPIRTIETGLTPTGNFSQVRATNASRRDLEG